MESNGYLSATELSDLVGCKKNQHARMRSWLDLNRWRYAPDINGFPKVARTHHDKQMGITEPTEGKNRNHEETPNLDAFRKREHRRR